MDSTEVNASNCLKLAEDLLQRKPRKPFPRALSLLNIGRVTGATLTGVALVLLCAAASANFKFYLLSTLSGLAFVLVPFLFLGILVGLRMGLLGLAEFLCGLAAFPSNALGGPNHVNRSYHTVAFIYSGCGRHQEALKYFGYHESNHNPFDQAQTSPWNERHRLPELLCRMGRDVEALRQAANNIARGRKDLDDFDCAALRQSLQSDLIGGALVAQDCGENNLAEQYLQQACDLYDESEHSNSQGRVLNLFAAGLLRLQQGHYAEGAEKFQACCSDIIELRKSDALNQVQNSELMGFSTFYLAQCYYQDGQWQKMPEAIKTQQKENQFEPPASVDKVMLEFSRADYQTASGNFPEALQILEKLIRTLSASEAHFDRFLQQATRRYQEVLLAAGKVEEATRIAVALEKMSEQKQLLLAPVHESTPAIQSQSIASPVPPARLPDLGATRRIANRSVLFFLAVLGYTLVGAVSAALHHSQFSIGLWGTLCLVSLVIAALHVRDQVHNRRNKALAAEALARGESVDIVVKPAQSALSGANMINCTIEEGPAELIGRKLELSISNNLIYATEASRAISGGKLKARLYKHPDSTKLLAIETLGRVLTVKTPGLFARKNSAS
ncbi:MAG: hypothetical protein JST01_18720 [Cyanobacteria bacterium SZAS TMP-1]|nr:hypothetical protein [Cyanobacteria bacterium SZAS TMP-1]